MDTLPKPAVDRMARKMFFNAVIAWDGWLIAMGVGLWVDGPLGIAVGLIAWHIGSVAAVVAFLWPLYIVWSAKRTNAISGVSGAPQRRCETRPSRGT